MSIENVENPFKNRLSFEFDRLGDWAMNGDFEIKEHISSTSKIFSLSSLNINNINDLMEEATPPIYYLFSWLEDHFKNKKNVYIPFNVEGARPFYIPDDFFVRLYFYDEVKEEKKQCYPEDYKDSKLIIKFEFKFDDLTGNENTLSIIKTHINKELEKNSCNIIFITDLIKIEIGYIIHHPPDVAEKMMEANYEEKQRYR